MSLVLELGGDLDPEEEAWVLMLIWWAVSSCGACCARACGWVVGCRGVTWRVADARRDYCNIKCHHCSLPPEAKTTLQHAPRYALNISRAARD
jgi:hypothetical protein